MWKWSVIKTPHFSNKQLTMCLLEQNAFTCLHNKSATMLNLPRSSCVFDKAKASTNFLLDFLWQKTLLHQPTNHWLQITSSPLKQLQYTDRITKTQQLIKHNAIQQEQFTGASFNLNHNKKFQSNVRRVASPPLTTDNAYASCALPTANKSIHSADSKYATYTPHRRTNDDSIYCTNIATHGKVHQIRIWPTHTAKIKHYVPLK